jgi:hypothetical protein
MDFCFMSDDCRQYIWNWKYDKTHLCTIKRIYSEQQMHKCMHQLAALNSMG